MKFETRTSAFSGKVVLDNIIDAEETVVIPDTVEVIKEGAMKNCSVTKKMVIPSSVEELHPVFDGCSNLETIVLSEGLKKLSGHTFKHCTALKHINLPESLEGRIDNAFAHCVSLESIKIPAKVDHIGYDYYKDLSGFTGCTNLKEVILEEGLTWIDAETFSGCTSLEEIIIPSTVYYVGARAFSGCSKLRRVIFKGKASCIQASTFQKCPSLKEVYVAKAQLDAAKRYLKDKVSYFTLEGKPFSSQKHQEAKKGETRKIANTLQTISNDAELLSSIDRTSSTIEIPAGVAVIPSNYFSGLENINTLILGPDIVSIEAGAFSGCKNIFAIALSSKLRSVAKTAFSKGPNWVHTIVGTKAAIEIGKAVLKGNYYIIPEPKKGDEKDLFDKIDSIVPLNKLLLWSKGLSPKAKYASTGKPAPGLLVNYIAYSYATQFKDIQINYKDCKTSYFRVQKNDLADEIAGLLDKDSLMNGLDKWIPRVNLVKDKNYPGTDVSILKAESAKKTIRSYCYHIDAASGKAELDMLYAPDLAAYCRYANDNQVQEIIDAFEIWENDDVFDLKTGSAKEKKMLQDIKNSGRNCVVAGRSALALNDSPVAKAYISRFKQV